MKAGRILEMEQYVSQKGSAGMEELCQYFQVSMNTVRRDVAELIRRGAVDKVYGGVCARKNDQALTPYEVRRIKKEEAKKSIGRAAAELVQDGDVIFIDSGTTTLQMVDFLAEKRDLTIITNNLEVILRALPYENISVISLPGQLQRKTNSFTGADSVRFLKRYNIRLAFMAATGLSFHGATNSSSLEYEIKQIASESCERAVLLVNKEKFGVTGLMTFAPVTAFHTVVSDTQPPEEYCQWLKNEGVRLLLASK